MVIDPNWIIAAATIITLPAVIAAAIYSRAGLAASRPVPEVQWSEARGITFALVGDDHSRWEIVKAELLDPADVQFCKVSSSQDDYGGKVISRVETIGRVLHFPLEPVLPSKRVSSLSIRVSWRLKVAPRLSIHRMTIKAVAA